MADRAVWAREPLRSAATPPIWLRAAAAPAPFHPPAAQYADPASRPPDGETAPASGYPAPGKTGRAADPHVSWRAGYRALREFRLASPDHDHREAHQTC